MPRKLNFNPPKFLEMALKDDKIFFLSSHDEELLSEVQTILDNLGIELHIELRSMCG